MTNSLHKIFIAKNIPNFITIARFFFIIGIIIFLVLASGNKLVGFFDYHYLIDSDKNIFVVYWLIASWLFIVAAASDFLDGYLARKYHWVTTFGKFMDPLVDKVLINITALVLAIFYSQMFPFWILIIFLMRDYLLDGIRLVVAKEFNIVVAANFWGKLKTILQLFAIIFILLIMPFFQNSVLIQQLILIPLYLAALVSIISCGVYIFDIYGQLHLPTSYEK